MHPVRRFYIEPGLGDLIWHLPMIETYRDPCIVMGPWWYKGKGMKRLIRRLLPNAMPIFGPEGHQAWRRDLLFKGYGWDTPAIPFVAHKWRVYPRVSFSPMALRRLQVIPSSDKKVLIHPFASTESRRWEGWEHLDLSGLDVMATGSPNDPRLVNAEYKFYDFFNLACLLRGVAVVVCVVSSVFCLARALGVKTICIYKDHISWACHPGTYVNLWNPSPAEVREAIDRALSQ